MFLEEENALSRSLLLNVSLHNWLKYNLGNRDQHHSNNHGKYKLIGTTVPNGFKVWGQRFPLKTYLGSTLLDYSSVLLWMIPIKALPAVDLDPNPAVGLSIGFLLLLVRFHTRCSEHVWIDTCFDLLACRLPAKYVQSTLERGKMKSSVVAWKPLNKWKQDIQGRRT